MIDRRKLLLGGAALALSGCKILDSARDRDSALRRLFASHEGVAYRRVQPVGDDPVLVAEVHGIEIADRLFQVAKLVHRHGAFLYQAQHPHRFHGCTLYFLLSFGPSLGCVSCRL